MTTTAMRGWAPTATVHRPEGVQGFTGLPDDTGVSSLLLDVVTSVGLDQQVAESVLSADLDRTIEGASTLTLVLHDPDYVLLRSGMFAHAIDVALDGLVFRLVKISTSAGALTLTLEDREVALLRAKNTPRKATRGTVTRAQFVRSLAREVKAHPIDFYCPPVNQHQAVVAQAPPTATACAATANHDRKPGLSAGAKLTWKSTAPDGGGTVSAQQRGYLEDMLAEADDLNAGRKATKALLCAAIVENELSNSAVENDANSVGILQARPGISNGLTKGVAITHAQALDVRYCARVFLTVGFWVHGGAIAVAKSHPEKTAGEIAYWMEGCRADLAYRYDAWASKDADRILDAWGGVATASAASAKAVGKYEYARGSAGAREDSWTCIQRLASEVNWRAFMVAGTLYFISDDYLLRSRVRVDIRPNTDDVDWIDFDLDSGKRVAQATVGARCARWSAPPGTIVAVYDCGPGDGRWLVSSISRSLFDDQATITLKRPSAKLAEPAAEAQSSAGAPKTASTAQTAPSAVERAYSAAYAIDQKHLPYVLGGGHPSAGSPSGGGYDCSGAVGAVLAAAGLGLKRGAQVPVSGDMARTWGDSGKGQHLTMYANATHVFLVFNLPGKTGHHFGTGDWGKNWGGAGFNPTLHPTAGFTARHWPGT